MNANDEQQVALPAIDPKVAVLSWIENILAVMFQGITASIPMLKPEILLVNTCRVMGRIAGKMYVGDELTVRRFRKQCVDEFREELFAQEIKSLPKPPVAQDTAPAAQKVN